MNSICVQISRRSNPTGMTEIDRKGLLIRSRPIHMCMDPAGLGCDRLNDISGEVVVYLYICTCTSQERIVNLQP